MATRYPESWCILPDGGLGCSKAQCGLTVSSRSDAPCGRSHLPKRSNLFARIRRLPFKTPDLT